MDGEQKVLMMLVIFLCSMSHLSIVMGELNKYVLIYVWIIIFEYIIISLSLGY